MKITLTIDTADYQHPSDAAKVLDELTIASEHGEGITIRTAGRKFTVDVVSARQADDDLSLPAAYSLASPEVADFLVRKAREATD